MSDSETTHEEVTLTNDEYAALVASCFSLGYKMRRGHHSVNTYCSAESTPVSWIVTTLTLPKPSIDADCAHLYKGESSSPDKPRLEAFFKDPFSEAAQPWIDYHSEREWYIEKWSEVVFHITGEAVEWEEFRKNSRLDCEVESSKIWLIYCHSSKVLSYLKETDEGETWLDNAADVYYIQKWLEERWRAMGIVWMPWRQIGPLLHTLRVNFLRSDAARRGSMKRGYVTESTLFWTRAHPERSFEPLETSVNKGKTVCYVESFAYSVSSPTPAEGGTDSPVSSERASISGAGKLQTRPQRQLMFTLPYL